MLFLKTSTLLLCYFFFLALQNIRVNLIFLVVAKTHYFATAYILFVNFKDLGFYSKGSLSLGQGDFKWVGSAQFELPVFKGNATGTDVYGYEACAAYFDDNGVFF